MEQLEHASGVGTRKVTKKKVILYLNLQKGWQPLPPNLRGESTRELGPSFEPAPSKSVCRGLNPVLEATLLPAYVGASADSQDFPAKATEYWNNWSMVAREEGTTLDISTEKRVIPDPFTPGATIEVDFPLYPDDYISYNMIMQNPKVAKTKAELEVLDNWRFYLVDLQEQKAKEEKAFDIESEATLEYAKIIAKGEEGREMMLQVLQLLKESGEVFNESMTTKELSIQLLKKSKLPLKQDQKGEFYHPFVRVTKDKNLGLKAFISRCLNAGIITKEGNSYFNGDEKLGNLKETISKLQEKTYGGELMKLQTRLEEATLKTV